MQRIAGRLALVAIAFLAGISTAHADFVDKIGEKILSECGLVATIFAGLAIYFARQATQNRSGWDVDRAGLLQIIVAKDERDAKMIAAYSKIEGMLTAAQQKHS